MLLCQSKTMSKEATAWQKSSFTTCKFTFADINKLQAASVPGCHGRRLAAQPWSCARRVLPQGQLIQPY